MLKPSGHADNQLWRRVDLRVIFRSDDLDARRRQPERRRRQRPATLTNHPEGAAEQERRRAGERVVDRHVLDPDRFGLIAGGEQVVGWNLDRFVVIGEEVTSVELVLPRGVVDFAHQLVVDPLARCSRERQPAVGPVRQRNVPEKVLRHRTDAICGDLIVDERLTGHRVDQTRRNGRKIASALRLGRHELHDTFGCAVDARALEGSEIEELVPEDRAAHAAARLIALQRVLRRREELSRVQGAVPDECKRSAVNVVRARLDDDVDDAAAGIAVLSGEVARLKVEFLHRVGVGKREARIQIRVVVTGGIELKLHLPLSRTVHPGCFFARI